MSSDLPSREAKLLAVLEAGGEVAIGDLLAAIEVEARTPRQDQAYVGVYISKLNKRLDGRRIVPGGIKRTYRLIDA